MVAVVIPPSRPGQPRCRRSKGPPQGIARRFPGLPVALNLNPWCPCRWLAGLGQAAKVAADPALREVADRAKVQIIPHGAQHPKSDRFSIMALQLRYPLDKTTTVIGDFIDTKLPEVVPSGNTGNVSYLFELCTPAEDNNKRRDVKRVQPGIGSHLFHGTLASTWPCPSVAKGSGAAA